MLTKLIPIGNSFGVRIPKVLLSSYKLGTKLEIIHKKDQIILKPFHEKLPRSNWKELFLKNKKSEKIEFIKSSFDQKDWEW